ncbi:MAG: nucleotidyltransferase domain-containing protein [Planctomycetes bacterium]|nr:nucleotidyltransferase domain-containing protein [Planctomycetota bacterium]
MPASLAHLLESCADRVLLRVVAGSRAYGLATPHSDTDERGVFALPATDYLALTPPAEHLQDERGDVVYFGLRKFLALATAANPSVLEMLFAPPDTVLQVAAPIRLLLDRRSMFVTQRCVESHVGYARAQIQRARSVNKWVNNPQPQAPPRREDFCSVVDGPWPGQAGEAMPMRPRPLADAGIDLRHYHCAALERVPRTYRLYWYGQSAKGVFRDGNLVCESIPAADEHARLRGLLIYDRDAFERAQTDHRHYWQWRHARNEARWRTECADEIDYDAKNMMHTFRLLLSAEAILAHGEPRVRFDGPDRDFLLRVRAGGFRFAELVEQAEQQVRVLEGSSRLRALPAAPEPTTVDRLLQEVTADWEAGRA